MSITYQIEPSMAEIKEEMQALVDQHFKECDARSQLFALDLDWELYEAMTSNGSCVLVSAREDGSLVGYASFVVTLHPHIKTCTHAMLDGLFVLPEKRSNGLAKNLILESERILQTNGVDYVMLAFTDENIGDSFCYKLGYKKTEVFYSKSLGSI